MSSQTFAPHRTFVTGRVHLYTRMVGFEPSLICMSPENELGRL